MGWMPGTVKKNTIQPQAAGSMFQRACPGLVPPVASVAVFGLVVFWPRPQLGSTGRNPDPRYELNPSEVWQKPVVVFLRKLYHKTEQVDVVQAAAVKPRGIRLAEEEYVNVDMSKVTCSRHGRSWGPPCGPWEMGQDSRCWPHLRLQLAWLSERGASSRLLAS